MASDREQQQSPTFYRNPPQGTVLYVAAGDQANAEFDFLNDSPDVALFCLDSDGLPDRRWIAGTGTQFEVAAAAAGGGTLRIGLQPAIDAVPGNYPFSLRILSANSVIGPQLNLVLSVGPAIRRETAPSLPVQAQQPAAPVQQAPPIPPVPLQSNFVPDPNRTWIAAEDPGWNNPNNPEWNAAKAQAAPPRPTWSPPPSPPTPVQPTWNAAPPVQNPAPAAPVPRVPVPPSRPPQPQQVPPVQPQPSYQAPAAPAPAWEPAPAAPAPAPNTNWNNPPSAAVVSEEPLHMVDLPQQVQEEREEDVKAPTAPVEPSVIGPRNGAMFPVRPGDTLLVRFPFVNTTSATTTYVLDEDRSLPQGWITLVQDQVNLSKNGEGEVSFRLSPTQSAEAGEYPFSISVGPQGGTIVQYSLILQVPVVPGVLLNAKSNKVTMGPFSHSANLHFFAEINGNADTAFRVSVKSQEDGQQDRDIYETSTWRYVFDKELDTLEAPSVHRASVPVPLRLRADRRGTWWFGFKETHHIRVTAVPVTEPDNGGKPGNTLDLSVSRWRILPIPVALFLPFLLFLLILGSGGSNKFSASNAFLDDQGNYWAFMPAGEQKSVHLAWNADRLAALKFTILEGGDEVKSSTSLGSGSYSDTVDVSNANREVVRNYSVTRVLGGGDRQLSVNYIYTANDTPLQVMDGTTGRYVTGNDIYVAVPQTGYAHLVLKNASTQFSRIDWWLADGLDDPGAPFQFFGAKNAGSIQPGGVEIFKIWRNPNSSLTPMRIVFITTDASCPKLTVHLTSN